MHSIIAWSFRRPIAISALFLLLILISIASWWRLPVALLPNLHYPALMVWTSYPDVPPERVERSITESIEEAVAGTNGLKRITSRAQLGGSITRLDFGWNTNLDLAMLEVREQLDRLGAAIPAEAGRPIVLRIDPSDRPIMHIALSEKGGKSGNLLGLKQVGKEIIARRIEQLESISRVRVTGGFDRRIDIQVEVEKMSAYGIQLEQLEQGLRAANIALPGGLIRRGPFQYAVEISGEFKDLEDIRATLIPHVGATPIRLSDVASVRESIADRRGAVRLDGTEVLLLLVERTPDANTITAVEEVEKVLKELSTELPRIQLDVVMDDKAFIENAIGGVTQSLWYGGLCATLVLFLFLRKRRILLAVGITIPLSLLLTFLLFEVFGVTFNLISLGGLALGVGMILDNAIVVIENVMRLHDEGKSWSDAALQGTAEVAPSIISSTLTNLVVFIPITFAEGLAGRLFRDQSLAVICSLSASLLVALFVVPLLMGRKTRSRLKNKTLPIPAIEVQLGRFMVGYERFLLWSLNHKKQVLIGCVLFLAIAGLMAMMLGREIVPKTDQGRIHARVTLPADADLPLLEERIQTIENLSNASKSIRRILSDLGERDETRLDADPRPPYQADLTFLLPEDQETKRVIQYLYTLKLPSDTQWEVEPQPSELDEILTTNDADLYLDLSTERRSDAEEIIPTLMEALKKETAIQNVRKANAVNIPAYSLIFNREALVRFGVSAATVTYYLEASARGKQTTELRSINESIPIVLKTSNIDTIEKLLTQKIPTTSGSLLPLSTFVQARFIELPAALFRYDQANVVRILADVAPDADLGSATSALEKVIQKTVPQQIKADIHGGNEAFLSSLQALIWSLLFSFVLVYLILVAEFENLKQPLIIMTVVPLAIAGVILTLWLTGQTINLMSLTGCIVLVGIVDNDAILKIDFINYARQQGHDTRTAILLAGRYRARPIIINTITAVLGMLPSAFDVGQGVELRMPLAISIAGGLTIATVLTLFVVPVLYESLTKK